MDKMETERASSAGAESRYLVIAVRIEGIGIEKPVPPLSNERKKSGVHCELS